MQNSGKSVIRGIARWSSVLAIGAAILGVARPASAETVYFAQEYGIGYLPLMVMRHNGLIQKYAKANGVTDLTIKWATFGGGSAMNAALLSGDLDFASGGVGPLLKMWDKTKGIYDVHGVAALNSMPNLLNTTDPNLHNISQITDKDRIALPAVKVSIQAVTLQMAAAAQWGDKNYAKLDDLTVSMKHPDATAALISGSGEINCDFTAPPYSEQELQHKGVHTVLSSYDVLGGKSTFNALWTSQKFYREHPKLYKAVFEALQAADRFINEHPQQAAEIYIAEEHSKLPKSLIEQIIKDPQNEFTTTPKNIMKYAQFMYKTGSIKHLPASWKDIFFRNVWPENGS